MTNPHRRSGANEAFGHRAPWWALVFGDHEARAHAHGELGRRHWLSTLFGRLAIGLVMAMAAVVAVAKLATWVMATVSWSWLWVAVPVLLVLLFLKWVLL